MRTQHFNWTNNAWAPQDDTLLVYDSMNVVQERDGTNNTVKAMYTRGLDMGGCIVGVGGGIGGILARTTSSGTYSFHYDGRGNVAQLTDASGLVVGRYDYDAFGNTVQVRGGDVATSNPFRFSTKELVDGLYDYGYRFYAPSLGKWINRDPIRERGGVNLYGFVRNCATGNIDTDGRFIGIIGGLAGGAALGGLATYLSGGSWCDVRASAAAGAISGAIVGGLDEAGYVVWPWLVGGLQNALSQVLKDYFCNPCIPAGQKTLRALGAALIGAVSGWAFGSLAEGGGSKIELFIANYFTVPILTQGMFGFSSCPGNSGHAMPIFPDV